MKKLIGRIVILAAVAGIFGIVGHMDYLDQQRDAKEDEVLLNLIKIANANLPPLDQVLFAENVPVQPPSRTHNE